MGKLDFERLREDFFKKCWSSQRSSGTSGGARRPLQGGSPSSSLFAVGSVSAQRRGASSIPAGPMVFAQSKPHRYLGGASAQLVSSVIPVTPPRLPTHKSRVDHLHLLHRGDAPRFFRPLAPPTPSSAPAPSCSVSPPAMLVHQVEAPPSPSRKVNRCTHFLVGGKKKEEKEKHPAKQTAILTQPPVGGGGAKPRPRPVRSGSGVGVSPRLHKLHAVSPLERQTPFSKHNKAASAFLQFTSIEETEVSLQMNNLLRIGHI